MSKHTPSTFNEEEYQDILRQAVEEIRTARSLVAKQINRTTNAVYWNLGKLLSQRQLNEGYGSGVVKQLSVDLKHEFPDMGVSPRNLWDMKRFYERYHQADIKLRQAVAVLPWGHNLLLLSKVSENAQVEFYAHETTTKGWSRALLLNAIKMDSYSQAKRQVKTPPLSAIFSVPKRITLRSRLPCKTSISPSEWPNTNCYCPKSHCKP